MDIQRLRTFQILSETLHFRRAEAARRKGVARSTLQRFISTCSASFRLDPSC